MANPIPRINTFINKICTTHNPYDQDGNYNLSNSKKAQAIISCLEELKLDYICDNRYGIIASKGLNKDKKNNKAIKEKLDEVDLIIVSHIDMISKFNQEEVLNKFKLDYEKFDSNNENDISGPLDNTITNAALLAMLDLRVKNLGDDCNDIMVIFTIGEEMKEDREFKEACGIKNFMKKFNGYINDDTKFLNLDVTGNEYHEFKNDEKICAAIEYDTDLVSYKDEKKNKYSKLNIFDSDEIFEHILFCEYEDGTSDDLEEITRYEDTFGLSLSLNTYGEIHSINNYTKCENIDTYFNQLNYLLYNRFLRPNCNISKPKTQEETYLKED